MKALYDKVFILKQENFRRTYNQ